MSRTGEPVDPVLTVAAECSCAGTHALSAAERRSAWALFTAPQTLSTYGVAICLVATITRAARTILRTEADSIVVPLAASLVIGCAILTIVAVDRRTRPRGPLEWLSAVLVAGVNSLVVFTATLGIDKF